MHLLRDMIHGVGSIPYESIGNGISSIRRQESFEEERQTGERPDWLLP